MNISQVTLSKLSNAQTKQALLQHLSHFNSMFNKMQIMHVCVGNLWIAVFDIFTEPDLTMTVSVSFVSTTLSTHGWYTLFSSVLLKDISAPFTLERATIVDDGRGCVIHLIYDLGTFHPRKMFNHAYITLDVGTRIINFYNNDRHNCFIPYHHNTNSQIMHGLFVNLIDVNKYTIENDERVTTFHCLHVDDWEYQAFLDGFIKDKTLYLFAIASKSDIGRPSIIVNKFLLNDDLTVIEASPECDIITDNCAAGDVYRACYDPYCNCLFIEFLDRLHESTFINRYRVTDGECHDMRQFPMHSGQSTRKLDEITLFYCTPCWTFQEMQTEILNVE